MTNDILHTLKQLHEQLHSHPSLDSQTIESLKSLSADITRTLEEQRDSTETPIDTSLSQRVQSMIEEFEMRHPALTNTLASIAERLADMGI